MSGCVSVNVGVNVSVKAVHWLTVSHPILSYVLQCSYYKYIDYDSLTLHSFNPSLPFPLALPLLSSPLLSSPLPSCPLSSPHLSLSLQWLWQWLQQDVLEAIPDSAVTVTHGVLTVKSVTAYDLQEKNIIGQQVPVEHFFLCTILFLVYYTVLYCTVLYCTVLYCTVLYCTVLYCTVLYCTVLYRTVLFVPRFILFSNCSNVSSCSYALA